MTPTVSVIVPNYNHAPFLKERIDSVLNQTYWDYEVIILDDCSSDNSREVIDLYRSNPRISHIVYNSKNSGSTFKQWEKGINLAKGEIIWIAESDDVAQHDFVESLVQFFKDSLVGIVFCASKLIDQNSNLLSYSYDNIYKAKLPKDSFSNKFDSDEFCNLFLSTDNYIYNASAVLFRKSLWNAINRDFTCMKSCGDWMCWLYMLEKCNKIVRISKELNQFRIHPNKVTAKSSSNGLIYSERLSIVNYLCDKKYISFFKKLYIIGWSYLRIEHSELNEDVKKSILNYWGHRYPFRKFYLGYLFLYKKLERLKDICNG